VSQIWIPIALFSGLTVVLTTAIWIRYKTRSEMQLTIRTAIDKGQELSPEIVDRLGNPKPHKDKDLRSALVCIAIAIGMSVFGYMIPEDEATPVFLGMAAFPFFVGIAFLIMWRVTERPS
jgi:hypothetical protein